MNEEIITLIEKNYPFTSEQRQMWGKIKSEIFHEEALCDRNVYMLDKRISKLGDGHTRLKNIIPPCCVFMIDLIWKEDCLVWVENSKGYIVKDINEKSVRFILEEYQREYGLKKLFLKRQIINDIKNGEAGFQTDSLKIHYILEGEIKEKEFFKKNIQELKTNVSEEVQELLKESNIFVKKIDKDTLYIKITSFYNQEIVGKFAEAVSRKIDFQIKNIVIDIRDNLGGYVDIAKELTSYVIDRDVQFDYEILDAAGHRENYMIESRKMNELNNKTLYLFVNQNTQSSAEYIFARALKLVNKDIIIVGTNTAGLSGQAKEYIINDRYMLSVATKRYLVPGTYDTVECGVTPTIVVNESHNISDMTKDVYIDWYIKNKNTKKGMYDK